MFLEEAAHGTTAHSFKVYLMLTDKHWRSHMYLPCVENVRKRSLPELLCENCVGLKDVNSTVTSKHMFDQNGGIFTLFNAKF